MTLQVILALAASACNLGGAVWALTHRAGRAAAPQAGVYSLLAMVWAALPIWQSLGLLNGLRSDFQARLPIYGSLSLSIALMVLTRRLVGLPPAARVWLLPAAWGAAVLAVDAGWLPFPEMLHFAGKWSIDTAGVVTAALISGWAVCLVVIAAVTIRTLRKTPRYYTALSYWAPILLIIVAGDALVFLGQPAAGNLIRSAATLPAAAVAAGPRLPAFEHSLRRALATLVYLVGAVAIYTAALLALQFVFTRWGGAALNNRLAISLASAAALALLFTPLLQRLARWSRRAVVGENSQTAAGLLRSYSQSITGTLDLDRLAALVLQTAGDFLQAKRGFLFLVSRENGANERPRVMLHGIKSLGPSRPDDMLFSDSSPLVEHFQNAGGPVTQAEVDQQPYYAGLPVQDRAWLDGLAAEVYIPIYAKGEWIGLLALGPKAAGTAYSLRNLALLSTLADQTAVALENARLVEGLMRLNKEFRRAYAALDQANRHLERLDKTKSDFISIASHELLTPLTLINGASQMLLDDPDLPNNSYHQQLMQKIKAGGDRLHEIVEAMLDLAKIDQRTLELEPQPVSLVELLRLLRDEIVPRAAERSLAVELALPDDLPAVIADAAALRKVFAHLLSNAIKYTPDGGRIEITGRKLEPNLTDLPHGGVEIVIRDSGIGIDPRFHELVFVKFYQTGELALHSTGKTKFKGGGPGLGLAIARGIVEAHNGRVWVESPGYDEENCPGSRFHVVLPLRPGELPAATPAPL